MLPQETRANTGQAKPRADQPRELEHAVNSQTAASKVRSLKTASPHLLHN